MARTRFKASGNTAGWDHGAPRNTCYPHRSSWLVCRARLRVVPSLGRHTCAARHLWMGVAATWTVKKTYPRTAWLTRVLDLDKRGLYALFPYNVGIPHFAAAPRHSPSSAAVLLVCGDRWGGRGKQHIFGYLIYGQIPVLHPPTCLNLPSTSLFSFCIYYALSLSLIRWHVTLLV